MNRPRGQQNPRNREEPKPHPQHKFSAPSNTTWGSLDINSPPKQVEQKQPEQPKVVEQPKVETVQEQKPVQNQEYRPQSNHNSERRPKQRNDKRNVLHVPQDLANIKTNLYQFGLFESKKNSTKQAPEPQPIQQPIQKAPIPEPQPKQEAIPEPVLPKRNETKRIFRQQPPAPPRIRPEQHLQPSNPPINPQLIQQPQPHMPQLNPMAMMAPTQSDVDSFNQWQMQMANDPKMQEDFRQFLLMKQFNEMNAQQMPQFFPPQQMQFNFQQQMPYPQQTMQYVPFKPPGFDPIKNQPYH